MKRLSIIIITYNGLGFLTRCLESLRTFIEDPSCEVIIIDNYSTDGTLPFLRENYPQLQLILNSENRGVAAARNQGIAVAKGEKLLLLDNDTEANDDAIFIRLITHFITYTKHISHLNHQPRIGFAAILRDAFFINQTA